jgi:anti-sigma B factor antagonist
VRPYFDVDFVDRGDELVLVVVGELDVSTTDVLHHGLVRAEATEATQIVIDLDRVDFMDAAGLGVLVRHAAADTDRRRLRLTRGSAPVRRLLAMTGMRRQLPPAFGY